MMTPLGWLALAALFGVLLLPSPAQSRSLELARSGRLVRAADRSRRWRRPRDIGWARAAGTLGLAAVAGVYLFAGAALAVTTAALLGTLAFLTRDALRRRSALITHRHLLVAVRVLVGELEAGSQPAAALRAAASTGGHTAAIFARAAQAAADSGAAGSSLCAAADPGVRALGLAWQLGEATGVALAGVIGRVAGDLEGADEQRRTVAVALAGPRSSAALLSALPLLGIGLGAAMGARPLPLLIGTPNGRVLGTVGVLLDLAGVLWMHRILLRAQRP